MRYLLLLRRPDLKSRLPDIASDTLPDLKAAIDSDGIKLLTDDERMVTRNQDGSLVFIGRVFQKGGEGSGIPVTQGQLQSIRRTSAPDIFRSYWGSYVAVTVLAGQATVIRDPSGALPCYYIKHENFTAFFSDVETAIESGFLKTSIDWHSVIYHLWAVALRSERTALLGLLELPQGHSLNLGIPSPSTRQEWSPWDYVNPATNMSAMDQAERLRVAVQNCVGALASSFSHVQLCLSGGLDSSIVAACLAGGTTDVTCITLVSRGNDGDERYYASSTAKHLCLRLVDCMYRVEHVDIARSSASHLPRPVGGIARQAFDRVNEILAREIGAQALFNGNGGDNVFCYLHSASPVVDRFRDEFATRGTFRTINDVSRLTGSSVFKVVKKAAEQLLFESGDYQWRPQESFLNIDTISSGLQPPSHSWLMAPRRSRAGSKAHIAALLNPQNYVEGYPRSSPLELVTPLLAQPIVELCLGVPSWRWCAGGRDRSVARQAFEDFLPKEVISRSSKGGPSVFFHDIIKAHRKQLREHLHDGLLASERIIDPKALDAFFTSTELRKSDDHVRILALADAESWVRIWSSRCSM